MNKNVDGWEYQSYGSYEFWTWEDEGGEHFIRVDHNSNLATSCAGAEWEYTKGFGEWKPIPDNPNIKTLKQRLAFVLALARLDE